MADFTGTTGDDTLDGTSDADRFFGEGGADTMRGRAGDDLLVGGDGADTAVFETGRGSFVVTSPSPEVIAVAEGDGLSSGNGTDLLSGVETFAFGSNVLSAEEALSVFAPADGAEAPALPPALAGALADYEQTGSWSATGEAEPAPVESGGEAEADPLLAAFDGGMSWEEIAARVLANFEATGSWWF